MSAARRTRSRRWPRLDPIAVAVAPAGIVVVLAAQWLDGSRLGALVQGPSALVVFGGTLGAVLVSYSLQDLVHAVREAGRTFLASDDDTPTLAATLIALSIRAHRRGIPSLDSELDQISDPLLHDGLQLVVDDASPEMLAEVVALDKHTREAEEDIAPRIFEAAAGYAPTMGILGAVLGLMRVMEHLGAPGMLGSGIALAFVATVYGVGLSNLVLLPLAGRLRERAAFRARRRELIVQGLLALRQRTHPRLVSRKLRALSARTPRIEELAAHGVLRPARRAGSAV